MDYAIELRKVPAGIEIEDYDFDMKVQKFLDVIDDLGFKDYDIPDKLTYSDGNKYIITTLYIDDHDLPYTEKDLMNEWIKIKNLPPIKRPRKRKKSIQEINKNIEKYMKREKYEWENIDELREMSKYDKSHINSNYDSIINHVPIIETQKRFPHESYLTILSLYLIFIFQAKMHDSHEKIMKALMSRKETKHIKVYEPILELYDLYYDDYKYNYNVANQIFKMLCDLEDDNMI